MVRRALLAARPHDGEGAVHGPQPIEHGFPVTIERLGRRNREHGVALELGDLEGPLHALDNGTEEGQRAWEEEVHQRVSAGPRRPPDGTG